jgi:predicted AlkP superfamily phosphohydrolase/phosphomutase
VGASDINPVDLLPDYCFASALTHERFVTEQFLTSNAVAARSFWDILADYGLATGIVNWPLTSPVHARRGYIISDRFDEGASEPLRLSDAANAWPTTAAEIARETFDAWQFRSWQDVLPAASHNEPEPRGLRAARWDRAYSLAASELERALPPRVTAMRYEGLDAFGHLYLNDAQPELFGLYSQRGGERSILDRYYGYIDSEIGDALRELSPGDLLLVVSGFGLEPETLAKRLFARTMNPPETVGSHERAPDGFLLAFGTNVAANQTLPRGAIVDLAPTVLYYLGLPVGRDVDGFARVDLFLRSYTVDHPVTYIATNEK